MTEKQYLITGIKKYTKMEKEIKKEIKKYKNKKYGIYASMTAIPVFAFSSTAATVIGLQYASTGNDMGFLVGIGGLLTTWLTTVYGEKKIEEYNFPKTETTIHGPDDWSKTEPSLKNQINKSDEKLDQLYKALAEVREYLASLNKQLEELESNSKRNTRRLKMR